jgi:hypothetical protein
VLRIRTVMSPSALIASVEIGSFSRRIYEGIRSPARTDRPGDLRGVSSGKGYAKYVAGFVVRRDWAGEEGTVFSDKLGRAGRASSVNFGLETDEIVKR